MIKTLYTLITLGISIPMILIKLIWMFLIEIPWSVAQSAVDEIMIKLNDSFKKGQIEKEKPVGVKSKFQQRLDDAIETAKKVKNGN